MSDTVLVKVEGVRKKFCRSLKKSLWYGVKDMATEVIAGKGRHHTLRDGEFWAVNDVSFELRRGECLGLIGRNGAGKTTLLKILNGLIKPDAGSIAMRGRVGALIALGAGFNPILTGRENIYVNASVLGLTKREVDSKIDEIIDFAEIGEFIDTPVQSYSSGMAVRLGFSVATAIEPDVLLLDEVLAVGDAGFRHKCYSRISKLLGRAAVIFVSHDMDYVAQMCQRVLHMHQGNGRLYENAMDGVVAYNETNKATADPEVEGLRAIYPPVRSADFLLDKQTVRHGESLEVRLQVDLDHAVPNANVSFVMRNEANLPILSWDVSQFDAPLDFPGGLSQLRFLVGPLFLHPGKYNCSIFVTKPKSIEYCVWFWNQQRFTLVTGRRELGGIPVVAPYCGHSVTSAAESVTPR